LDIGLEFWRFGGCFVTSNCQGFDLGFYTFTSKNMQNYFDLLKKCKTLHWAAQVYIAVLLDEKLTNKEKNTFQDVYVEYTQNLKN
jgi:hypothetical protein